MNFTLVLENAFKANQNPENAFAMAKYMKNNFPFFGIWAAKDADFVCIEPWYGIADNVNSNGKLTDKEGIIKLPSNQIFEAAYKIELF